MSPATRAVHKVHSTLSRLNKKRFCALFIIPLVFASSFIGYIFGSSYQREHYANFLRSFKNIRENSDKYKFINPLIGGISPPATDVGIFLDLKKEVTSYLEKEEIRGDLYDYSFYFRDLGTGFWFGANEGGSFFPASLFKLPIAIATYKQAEADPLLLKKMVTYSQDISELNSSIQTNSQSTLVVGRSYSVEDLIERMIISSDNGAKNLLVATIDKTYLNQLFSAVSPIDPDPEKMYKISSQKYALFLRILYGSSYLNEEHSEYLLNLLSQTDFKDGLVAGIPESIPVAHKFGTYEFEEKINGVTVTTHQLHDCGVVYHADKPYIFCFMTKGKDIASLYRIISHVSRLIYENQEKDQ